MTSPTQINLGRAVSLRSAPEFELLRPQAAADPTAIFRKMMEDRGPVQKSAFGYWFVMGYHDTKSLLTDPRMEALHELSLRPDVAQGLYPTLERFQREWLLFANGDQHGRLRRSMIEVVTRRTQRLFPLGLSDCVESCLKGIDWSGPVDMVEDIAKPIPRYILGELLGVPASDRGWLGERTAVMSQVLEPFLSDDRLGRAEEAAAELVAYYDTRGGFAQAHLLTGEHSSELREQGLFANLILLNAAGHETTTNLLAVGIFSLLADARALAVLPEIAPDKLNLLVEELLRFASPIQLVARVASENVARDDYCIERGDVVIFVLAAANRDADVFPDADVLIPDRSPNRHVAFGSGPHHCVGASLARAEAKAVLRALSAKLPLLSINDGSVVWSPKRTVRGLKHLVVQQRLTS